MNAMKVVPLHHCRKSWDNMVNLIDPNDDLSIVEFRGLCKKTLKKFNARFEATTRSIEFQSEADYVWFILTYS